MLAHSDGSVTFTEAELRAVIRSLYRAGADAMRGAIEDRARARGADSAWIAKVTLQEAIVRG